MQSAYKNFVPYTTAIDPVTGQTHIWSRFRKILQGVAPPVAALSLALPAAGRAARTKPTTKYEQ